MRLRASMTWRPVLQSSTNRTSWNPPMSEVNTRIINWRDVVLEAWGDAYNVPETVYNFSGARKFQSTDGSDHGIYRRGTTTNTSEDPGYEGVAPPEAVDYDGTND